MDFSPWFNCRTTPPVNAGGPYEYRLWEPEGYTPIFTAYYTGEWVDKWGTKLTGKDRPGWHKKDEWRGVLR